MLFIASNHEQNGLGPYNISQYHFIISVCNYLVSFTLRSQLSYIFSYSLKGKGKIICQQQEDLYWFTQK